ncbi:hypothetical protein KI688_004201 [Linnemannia hyalina]|uniref:Uncharacterized protein n=1 Tax=Linnemannia hyalina TaxID=64524 RepID=A0A9P7XM89_9FUNG|nr:hypothetical protein KI688_004201 [Linnemannia hyalina]
MNTTLLNYDPLEDTRSDHDEEKEVMNDDVEREQHSEDIDSEVNDDDPLDDDFDTANDVIEDDENGVCERGQSIVVLKCSRKPNALKADEGRNDHHKSITLQRI